MSLTTLVAEPVSLPAVEIKKLPPEPTRFNALTGFRCLAACLVFVYHNRKYWRNSLPTEVVRLFNEFHIGVSLFFVLSGFLIAYTYGEKPLQSYGAYSRYILLRLARIMPLYWLILTCYYIDTPYGKGAFTPLTYSLAHAFSNVHNLDGLAQAWSLNVELCFYGLAPLLCLLQRKHLLYLIAFLAILLIAALTALRVFLLPAIQWDFFKKISTSMVPTPCLACSSCYLFCLYLLLSPSPA